MAGRMSSPIAVRSRRLARPRQARRADRPHRRRRRTSCRSPLFRANRIVLGEATVDLRGAAGMRRRRCWPSCWPVGIVVALLRAPIMRAAGRQPCSCWRCSSSPSAAGELPDARGRHARPGLARRRVLAAALCLRAARGRCPGAAASSSRGCGSASWRWSPRRIGLLLWSRRLERSVDAQGIRQPRRRLLARGADACGAGARLAAGGDGGRHSDRHPLPPPRAAARRWC